MSSEAVVSPHIDFISASHTYVVEGIPRPSVTEILRATGVSTDFEQIGAMSERARGNVTFKRDLGSALHADIHAFDDDDLDWETVDDRVLPYIEAWAVFRQNSQLVPLARERRVFHPTLNYCGTLDGIFRMPDGRHVLIDVKTGDPLDAAAHLQLAAYQLAYACAHDTPIHERWSVQLIPTRRVPYDTKPYPDYADFVKWPAIVTTYWEQASRRSRHA